jgi:hypothetical protein
MSTSVNYGDVFALRSSSNGKVIFLAVPEQPGENNYYFLGPAAAGLYDTESYLFRAMPAGQNTKKIGDPIEPGDEFIIVTAISQGPRASMACMVVPGGVSALRLGNEGSLFSVRTQSAIVDLGNGTVQQAGVPVSPVHYGDGCYATFSSFDGTQPIYLCWIQGLPQVAFTSQYNDQPGYWWQFEPSSILATPTPGPTPSPTPTPSPSPTPTPTPTPSPSPTPTPTPTPSPSPTPTPTPTPTSTPSSTPTPSPGPEPHPLRMPAGTRFAVTVLFNSSVEQTVEVYLDQDTQPSYTTTGSGNPDDNRGTTILTAKTGGIVRVKVIADGRELPLISRQVDLPHSQTTYVAVIAAYNGSDKDDRYNDAYVLCNWTVASH